MSKEEKIKEVSLTDKLVLVEFYATWCTHCVRMKPVMHAFKEEMKGIVEVIEVDIDKNESLASFYNVQNSPTIVLMKQGEELWRQSGEIPLERLRKVVKDLDV